MKKILLILVMTFTTSASAALHKWADENGQVHYSDQPPPANARVKILSAPVVTPHTPASGVPATSAPAAAKTTAEREAELQKARQARQEAADQAAKEQAAADAAKASCATAQQNLRTLQSGIRIMEIDASGQPFYLDEEQRQQRTSRAQQEIETYCKQSSF